MLDPEIDVTFRVCAEVNPGEVVCVCGNTRTLGNWRPQKARQLKLEKCNGEKSIWSSSARVPSKIDVEYRYFIGFIHESDHEGDERDVMVRCWECNMSPRVFNLKNHLNEAETEEVAQFGTYGGKHAIDKGWLTGQTEIQLRLHSSPITLWKRRQHEQVYQIKCTAIDLRYKDIMMDDDSGSNMDLPTAMRSNQVKVAILNGKNEVPKHQDQFGAPLQEADYMIFTAQSFEPESLGFQFDFYEHTPNGGPGNVPKHIGQAYILPVNLNSTNGKKSVPITSTKYKPMGQLAIDYLITRPLKGYSCDMHRTYAKHWKRTRRPLDVGHRGMGSSYTAKECAVVRENTIASLSEAGGHGADFVEFDIQISKDKVPVIYHDFTVCLSLKKRGKQELEYFEIPVDELSLSQLQALKVDHASEKNKGGSPISSNDVLDPEDRAPFPTLKQCFDSLDPHIGFNIEIKYAMEVKSGGLEDNLKHFMERNSYIDICLKTILEHAGDRRVILSCFDPDICTMVRLKQNRYPISFLCYGPTAKYEPFRDLRARHTHMSISYGHSAAILGINMHSEDMLRDPSLIEEAKKMGLVVFAWGEDNNNKDNIKRLKEQGVDGVIYDRIHELKGSKENVFKMEHEAKVALLEEVGVIANTSPPTKPKTTATTTTSTSTNTGPDDVNSHVESMFSKAFASVGSLQMNNQMIDT